MLDTPADEGSGGKARIVDSKNFPISKTIAAGHLDIEPGAMREMHWHPNADEWYGTIGAVAGYRILTCLI